MPSQEMGEKLEALVYRAVVRYWRKLKSFNFGKGWQFVQDDRLSVIDKLVTKSCSLQRSDRDTEKFRDNEQD